MKKSIAAVGATLALLCSMAFPANAAPRPESESLKSSAVVKERAIDEQQIAAINAKLDQMAAEGAKIARTDAKAPPAGVGSMAAAGGTTNTYGDIWVGLALNSGSSGFAGHAAILSNTSGRTIESFAKSFSPIKKDGVQRYSNSWNSKKNVLLMRPKGQSKSKYKAAAAWAERQVSKPYNWNFFNKTTEAKFYCSQLVWRAWLKQGIDIEKGSIPNGAITPADIVNSSNTYLVKRR